MQASPPSAPRKNRYRTMLQRPESQKQLWQHLHEWWLLWWNNLYVACASLVLMVSPGSYSLAMFSKVALRVYAQLKWPLVLFLVLAGMLTYVITRIVSGQLVTYGMGRLTLPLLLRVIVIELVPLAAAIVVAIKMSIPLGAELVSLRRNKQLAQVQQAGGDVMRTEMFPRLMMSFYASTMLTTFASLLCMVMLYLAVYGYTRAGLPLFTHEYGRLMTPIFTGIYTVKVLLFGLVVGLIPLTSGLYDARYGLRSDTELATLARMLAILLLLEVVSLMLNYL